MNEARKKLSEEEEFEIKCALIEFIKYTVAQGCAATPSQHRAMVEVAKLLFSCD